MRPTPRLAAIIGVAVVGYALMTHAGIIIRPTGAPWAITEGLGLSLEHQDI